MAIGSGLAATGQRTAYNASPLGQANAAGLLNPLGSPVLRARTRANALRTAEAQRRRNSVLSRLMGITDPNQARTLAVSADQQASRGAADAINGADLSQLESGQDFARGLYRSQLDFDRQKQLAKMQQPGLGQQLGGLVGQWAGGGFINPFKK